MASFNLNLSSNSIGENGAKYLEEGFSKCATLDSLNINLYDNRIGDNGA